MKILIVTQVVDANHSALGFFVRWLAEFARQCESVTVLCLEAGKYDLPENVTVVSLGKSEGESRFGVLKNFYRELWSRRRDYSSVLVHMNPIYVALAGVLWRLMGKRVGLW